jgi:hypothetical protein
LDVRRLHSWLCGTTHFVEIWTLWYPEYAAQGLVKVATAAISVATAIILWPLIPHRRIALRLLLGG